MNKKIALKYGILTVLPSIITSSIVLQNINLGFWIILSSLIFIIISFIIGYLIGLVSKKLNLIVSFLLPSLIVFIFNLIVSIQNKNYSILALGLQPIINGIFGIILYFMLRGKR